MSDTFKERVLETCGFFRTDRIQFRSQEIQPTMQSHSAPTREIPWCSHPKHSPADLALVTKVVAGGSILRCGGDFARCQIAPEKFEDVT
jgi:hypothetical protein